MGVDHVGGVQMMMEIHAELYCVHCERETDHKIVYSGKYLRSIECTVCGKVISIDKKQLLRHYALDFLERVITKPHRMNKEMHEDLAKFVRTFPSRLIQKPSKIAGEVKDILKD